MKEKEEKKVKLTRQEAVKKIKKAREKIFKSGEPLLTINQIQKEVNKRRLGWE